MIRFLIRLRSRSVVAGDDVGAELSEDVVIGSRALRALGLEALDDSTFIEFEKTLSCLTRLGEMKIAELVDRENVMLVEIDADMSVSVGDPVGGSKDLFRSDTEERPLAGATSLTAHQTPGHVR